MVRLVVTVYLHTHNRKVDQGSGRPGRHTGIDNLLDCKTQRKQNNLEQTAPGGLTLFPYSYKKVLAQCLCRPDVLSEI